MKLYFHNYLKYGFILADFENSGGKWWYKYSKNIQKNL